MWLYKGNVTTFGLVTNLLHRVFLSPTDVDVAIETDILEDDIGTQGIVKSKLQARQISLLECCHSSSSRIL